MGRRHAGSVSGLHRRELAVAVVKSPQNRRSGSPHRRRSVRCRPGGPLRSASAAVCVQEAADFQRFSDNVMSGAVRHVMAHGSHSDKGTRYGALNQDCAIMEKVFSPADLTGGKEQIHVAAVMDGHGMLGEDSAQIVGRAVGRFLMRTLRGGSVEATDKEKMAQLMKEAFQKAHNASLFVYKDPPKVYEYPMGAPTVSRYRLEKLDGEMCYVNRKGEQLLECGTTCTAAVISENKIVLANVGDSTAVVGWVDDELEDYDGEAITRVHTCKDEEEAARCRGIPGASISPEDHYLQVNEGNWQGYEIAMTRALGHRLMNNYGIITEPDVVHFELEPRHCCLILATDGVWDDTSPREAVRVVMEVIDNGGSAAAAARALTRRGVENSLDSEKEAADNTTAAVYLFDL